MMNRYSTGKAAAAAAAAEEEDRLKKQKGVKIGDRELPSLIFHQSFWVRR